MNEIEKLLKDMVYGTVGAVATVLEAGSDLAQTFVEKGQEAVRQGQERAEEMKQAMKDACESMMNDPGIDVTGLNRAQRDELRRRLDEMDAAEEAVAAAEAQAKADREAEVEAAKAEFAAEAQAELDAETAAKDDESAAKDDPEPYGVTYETGSDDEGVNG